VIDEKEWTDSIVAEVQAVRAQIAQKSNHDIPAYFNHLREKEAGYEAQGFKFADLPTKRVPQKKTGTHG